MTMPLRRGVHQPLEDAANAIIRESLKGVTSYEAKRDILTPWKLADRARREVFARDGVVDPAIRKGMFGRARNETRPELNSRGGYARPRRIGSFASFVAEYGSDGAAEEAGD